MLALFTAMALHLIDDYGQLGMYEQPGFSITRHFSIFGRLLARGFAETVLDVCTFGSPFKKSSSWVANFA